MKHHVPPLGEGLERADKGGHRATTRAPSVSSRRRCGTLLNEEGKESVVPYGVGAIS